MIRHVVMFKMAASASYAEIERLLNELPQKVPGIRYWQVGHNAGKPAAYEATHDFWDVTLIADFDTWAAFESYSVDSFHLSIVDKLMPMFTARAMTDYEFHK
jgi:Stress responsive A/B Barrel Domain